MFKQIYSILYILYAFRVRSPPAHSCCWLVCTSHHVSLIQGHEASYPVVLVRCDRCEAGFLKNKGFVILLGIFLAVLTGVHINHMKPGLVAVHGVQNDL